MEQLIPTINKLQDAFNSVGVSSVELPQLVVVGCQSAGKSSVLEHIVGRDFLPRGSSIVTRRPLVLQLVNTRRRAGEAGTEGEGPAKEWGEFLHLKGRKFEDFNAIREEIQRETERLVGQDKGISAVPISLKIYSPRVLNLSLVDLPGITKVPVGDQPLDIENQVRSMVLNFISNPQAVIVAVTPANSDMANSDALKLAREVDPQGDRTLGVITKIDLMDKGTDAMDMLNGTVYPLQLGFVGVVNRCQQDINERKSIDAALEAERKYFQSNQMYRPIAAKLGTAYLTKRLNTILLRHIQRAIPSMRMKISLLVSQTRTELDSYGLPLLNAADNLGPMLLHLMSKFCNNFGDALEGRSPDISTTQLYGGARISYVFHDIFGYQVDNIDPFQTLTDHDIRTAIRNATGPRPSLFIPEISFELLVKRQIERLLSPALECVDLVFEELKRVARQAEELTPELSRFPVLRERLHQTVQSLLQRRVKPTKEMISNLIHIELAYINTNHPDFIGGSNAVSSHMQMQMQDKEAEELREEERRELLPPDERPPAISHAPSIFTVNGQTFSAPEAPTERELIETDVIKSLITSYFAIVKKNIVDTVPKSVMHFLVNFSKGEIQSELVKVLYRQGEFEDVLQEADDVTEKRMRCVELLKVLQKAMIIVNQVHDFDRGNVR